MVSNFEVIKDYRDVRSMAEAFTKSNMCCDKSKYDICQAIISDNHFSDKEQEKNCFRCWLDFLTDDSGLYSKEDGKK